MSTPQLARNILGFAIAPAAALLPARMDSQAARVLVLAIMAQESGLTNRQQLRGPAHGLAQFELGGGVRGVLTHPASRFLAADVCRARNIDVSEDAVYAALLTDDVLAAAFARLLLWTDPAPLPPLGAVDDAWAYYLRNWRPGKPHPERWPRNYELAASVVI